MKWNIKNKLTLSFGTIVLFTIIFGFYTINTQSRYEKDLTLYDIINEESSLVADVQLRARDVAQYFADAALTGENESVDKAEKYGAEGIKILDNLIEIVPSKKEFFLENKMFMTQLISLGREIYEAYKVSNEEGNARMLAFDKIMEKMNSELDNYETEKSKTAKLAVDEMLGMNTTSISISWIIMVLSTLLASSVAFVMIKNFTKPIKILIETTEKFGQGDMHAEAKIYTKDEFSNLANSINSMIQSISKSQTELKLEKESVERKVEEAVREAENQKSYLAKSTKILLDNMEKFANGDLTINIVPEKENDDVGKLFLGFKSAVQNIKNMLANVTEAVEATASASNEISSSSEQMAAGAQEQSAQASEVASAVTQMTSTILQTTKNATTASENAKNAKSQAKVGVEKITEAKKGMNEIISSAQTTGKIISSLANKTDQIGEIAQ
ncbi:MAG: HAMP domain-containing protein, partial [Melioribacter sp.]|nr:HAMP domain-containing protein [Melioribacter sp.]